jgi:hypothetical protein
MRKIPECAARPLTAQASEKTIQDVVSSNADTGANNFVLSFVFKETPTYSHQCRRNLQIEKMRTEPKTIAYVVSEVPITNCSKVF